MNIRERLYSRVIDLPPAFTVIARLLSAAVLLAITLIGGWFYLNNIFGSLLFIVSGLVILKQRKVWLEAWWGTGAYSLVFGYSYIFFGLIILAYLFA